MGGNRTNHNISQQKAEEKNFQENKPWPIRTLVEINVIPYTTTTMTAVR